MQDAGETMDISKKFRSLRNMSDFHDIVDEGRTEGRQQYQWDLSEL